MLYYQELNTFLYSLEQVIINNNRTLIPNFWWINLIFYLIYKTPIKFLVFIKKLKNFIKLQYEKYLAITNYRV